MSYSTEADHALVEAKEAIQKAADALARIAVNRVEGYDDFHGPYRRRVAKALEHVCDARALLEDDSD